LENVTTTPECEIGELGKVTKSDGGVWKAVLTTTRVQPVITTTSTTAAIRTAYRKSMRFAFDFAIHTRPNLVAPCNVHIHVKSFGIETLSKFGVLRVTALALQTYL
jgi:hypothetical protein